MKESELAEHFINWFNDGYEVYCEVPCGNGIIDFVATDGSIYIGCEVKTSFGLAVLEQGVYRRPYFHYVYICVPQKRNYHFRQQLARDYGLGVLVAQQQYRHVQIVETERPDLNRSARTPDLKEYMKQSTAGSQSDRVTAFGNTVNQIRRYLKRRGPTHINDILQEVDHHYATISTAKSSLRKWINQGVIEGIEWDNAVLILTQEGN